MRKLYILGIIILLTGFVYGINYYPNTLILSQLVNASSIVGINQTILNLAGNISPFVEDENNYVKLRNRLNDLNLTGTAVNVSTRHTNVFDSEDLYLMTGSSAGSNTGDIRFYTGDTSGADFSGEFYFKMGQHGILSGLNGVHIGEPSINPLPNADDSLLIDHYLAVDDGIFIADGNHQFTAPASNRMTTTINRVGNIGLWSIENPNAGAQVGSRYCISSTCAQFVRFEGDDNIHAIYNAGYNYLLFANSAGQETPNFATFGFPCQGSCTPLGEKRISMNMTFESNTIGSQYFQRGVLKSTAVQIDSLIYGEMYLHNDSGVTTTISNSGQYYNVSGFSEGRSNFMLYENYTPTQSMKFRIPVEGNYKIDYSISFAGNPSNEYQGSIMIDHIEQDRCDYHRVMGTGGDVGNAGGTCILALEYNDLVTMVIKNNDGGNDATVYAMNINIMRIGVSTDLAEDVEG